MEDKVVDDNDVVSAQEMIKTFKWNVDDDEILKELGVAIGSPPVSTYIDVNPVDTLKYPLLRAIGLLVVAEPTTAVTLFTF